MEPISIFPNKETTSMNKVFLYPVIIEPSKKTFLKLVRYRKLFGKAYGTEVVISDPDLKAVKKTIKSGNKRIKTTANRIMYIKKCPQKRFLAILFILP
jgi:hypothetical protein